jgi:hypothetical protein
MTHYSEVFKILSWKDWRILIIRHITSSILNLDLTGLTGWPTHESQETNYRMVKLGWIKLPLDKSMKDDQNQAA